MQSIENIMAQGESEALEFKSAASGSGLNGTNVKGF